ncbi:MAG: hypothetical protein U9R22_00315 [Pseudomonadota bacterium]|nr:hypothetical protein [Pseudomonadota bacterium]
MRYRRSRIEGGAYFFTVNLANRRSDLLVRHVDELRAAMARVKLRHPFSLIAMVVLPGHLHAIWRLPSGGLSDALGVDQGESLVEKVVPFPNDLGVRLCARGIGCLVLELRAEPASQQQEAMA